MNKQQLARKVEYLNKITGQPADGYTKQPDGKYKANIGHYCLASNSPGDGWTRYSIEQICSDGGGVSQPFTRQSMTAGECALVLDAVIETIELVRRGDIKPNA